MCVLSTRDAAALLCQLLRHGDHRRRSLPRLERRHHPRIPWKRKSSVPGVDAPPPSLIFRNRSHSRDSLTHSPNCLLFVLPAGQPVAHLAGDGGGGGVGRRCRLRRRRRCWIDHILISPSLPFFRFLVVVVSPSPPLESPRLIYPLPAWRPTESPSLVEIAVLESL